jgi:methionyl-tRNA formyltransferase
MGRALLRSPQAVLLGCGIEPQRLRSQEMREFCEHEGVPWFDARSIRANAKFDRIMSAGVDLIVVGAFGQMLDRRILQVPRYGVLNFHPSLLPAYKGGSPIEEQILAGDPHGGVTLHWMTEQVDEGPTVMSARIDIGPEDDYATVLHNCVSQAEMMLGMLLSQSPLEWPRQAPAASGQGLCSPRKAEDGRLDWDADIITTYRKILALGWREWARFIAADGELIVRQAKISSRANSGSPGEVLSIEPAVRVACRDGVLELLDYSFPRALVKGEVLTLT